MATRPLLLKTCQRLNVELNDEKNITRPAEQQLPLTHGRIQDSPEKARSHELAPLSYDGRSPVSEYVCRHI